MQYQFDNVGVAQLQTHILALPEAERQLEIDRMQADIVAWLRSKFDFSTSQQEQLLQLPQALLDELAAGIAAVWGQAGLIGFYKKPQAPSSYRGTDDRDNRKGKDVLFRRAENQNYAMDDDLWNQSSELQIWIT